MTETTAMGDKDPGKKDADAKEKKKKRHALIKELQKQIDEQAKQIESLKLRLQNQLKDSIKIQTTNRHMRRLWCVVLYFLLLINSCRTARTGSIITLCIDATITYCI